MQSGLSGQPGAAVSEVVSEVLNKVLHGSPRMARRHNDEPGIDLEVRHPEWGRDSSYTGLP